MVSTKRRGRNREEGRREERDCAPMRLMPKTFLMPIILLFCAGLGGASNLQEALSDHYFFQPESWWLPWLCLALYYAGFFAYLKPIFLLRFCSAGPGRRAAESKLGPRELATIAVARFRFLAPLSIVHSFALFLANDALLAIIQRHHFDAAYFIAFKSLVDCGLGLFLGVLMLFFLENKLFPAKKMVHLIAPDLPIPYRSFYSKILLVMVAITVHLVIQTVAVLPSFITLPHSAAASPAESAATGAPPPSAQQGPNLEWPRPMAPSSVETVRHGSLQWMKKNAEVLLHAGTYGAKDILDVYFLQLAIDLVFVLLLLRQVNLLIKKPLATIGGRLRDLNKGSSEDLRAIEIVQNDEFASVYQEINRLIGSQKAALSASREMLAHVIESAADPILVFDGSGSIRLCNPAAQAFFGYDAEELGRRSFCDLIEMPEGLSAACSDSALPLIAYLREYDQAPARYRCLRKDGERRPFEANVGATETDSGTIYTAILRDVSAQVAVEEALTAAKLAAEKANRMKSEFLANMSHELRTPLNAVLGYTQLLSGDRNLTGAQLEKIGIISRSGEHLLALINDILDLSKIEAGKFEMNRTVFDLEAFVGDLRDMFALRCEKKRLNWDVESLEGLPRYVRGDLGKLRQVMINLVGNAVKYSDEGGVGVVIGPEGDLVRFSVHDTGRGIPADELELIMQPFRQASTTDHEGGTGLGLTISHRFVEMLGGKLEVESRVGVGSTFSFTIPLEATDERPASAGPEISAARVKGEQSVLVLIVDDKETNRLVLKEMLEGAGFATVEAGNGLEAVERCVEFGPRLVLMDIKMPVMDGYKAARRMKGDQRTAAIPLFALTASAFKHDEEQIRAAGFDDYLAKPFKRSDLFRLIRDRTDIAIEYELAAGPAGSAPRAEAEPPKAILARLGKAGLAKLEELASINDFTAIEKLAESLGGELPGFAAELRLCASSYDEAGIAKIIDELRKAREEA